LRLQYRNLQYIPAIMEIILLKNVIKLGLANSVVTVKPGYARNFLIPQGMALEASARNRNILQQKISQQEERASKLLEEAKELALKLTNAPLRIAAKAGTSGKIFGSVTSVQIAQAIQQLHGIEVERRFINIVEEVKMLGSYTAKVHVHPEVAATVTFDVYDDKPVEI
jgi:large subunit ribosomal protein L9